MTNSQKIRARIVAFMSGLPIPLSHDGDGTTNLHWRVRGNQQQGVYASFADDGDVIEFGLLDRDGDEAINLLHVIVSPDEDEAQVTCVSESNTDMNFDIHITHEKLERLDGAMRFFGETLREMAE